VTITQSGDFSLCFLAEIESVMVQVKPVNALFFNRGGDLLGVCVCGVALSPRPLVIGTWEERRLAWAKGL